MNLTQTDARTAVDVEWLADRASLCEVFQETVQRVPDRPAFVGLDGRTTTWAEYGEQVRRVATGLASLGVGRGSVVALMMTTRTEFHVVDTAVLHLGATPVSVYNTLPVADIEYVLRDSGAEVVVCEAALLERADAARRAVGVKHLVTLDCTADAGLTLEQLAATDSPGFDFEASWRGVGPHDLAVLVYTSGTTGDPKGVELSHRAILGNQQGLNIACGLIDGATTLSFLPMAHVAERQLSHYRPMVGGMTVTPVADLKQIPAALAQVRPDYFFSPPRLWEKFRAALIAGAAADERAGAALARMTELGERIRQADIDGVAVDPAEQAELDTLRSTVGRPMLAKLGLDNVSVALTGAAPVPPDLTGFWLSLGLVLLEAWGLTECGAFGAFNRPDRYRAGTVGGSLPGVEQRLLEDGEVLLRSPWLMTGYRNRPEQTAEAIDADGWLHSGDVGRLDADGFLSIIDRKKEIMINAAGKNMSPANIEAKLRDADPIIAQAVAIGERRPYNVALIVLDPDTLTGFAAARGIAETDYATLTAHPSVVERVQTAVDAANELMSRVEQIKRFTIMPHDWAPSGDELTPTMKLRRRSVGDKYADQIEALYATPREDRS
jgi:long-chain acyl-CoA synthetase